MTLDLSAAWISVAGASQESLDCWTRLIGRWTEPHRRHHGIAHLSAVLLFIDEYAGLADDPDAVRLAAWYHDAIYDPRASDNEERSTALAANELGVLGLAGGLIDEVARLVLLTVTHDPADDDRNGVLLSDADLLVLASPPDAYAVYANAIRQEYAHVSDADFRTGRAAVLDALLESSRLYRLDVLAPLEAAARRNMKAELSLLRPDRDDPDRRAAEAGDEGPNGQGPQQAPVR